MPVADLDGQPERRQGPVTSNASSPAPPTHVDSPTPPSDGRGPATRGHLAPWRRVVEADAVVLATGRERPGPARLIPGDRPDGVYTTGQLHNLVPCTTPRSVLPPL